MKLRCIIVDDEPAGRKVLMELVSETPFLELAGMAEHPGKALDLLEHEEVQLMFLDVQMPKMNGIDFLKSLRKPPIVILTTAYPQYALQGFELAIMDYLLKPISFERFLKAAMKAKDYYEIKQEVNTKFAAKRDFFFIKCDNVYEKIRYADILFIEALNNFVSIYTYQRKFVAWLTMKSIEESLPDDQFIKIHRSFIAAVSKIERITGNEICVDGHTLPISKSMRADVLERLLNKHLLQR